ncbi:MAG: NHLP bacteriocin system secretion protein [Planctomycetia bacterium TMED53]|nr:MAG: NHLP bacteriocin system secretion protein [Planctomycetia bacterium TMED53]
MSAEKPSLFQKKALEHISTPEQLDTMLEVLPRRNWLPVFVVGLGMACFILWCFFGQIPVNVKANGIMVFPGKVVPLHSHSQGQLLKLKVGPGESVQYDQVIAEVYQPELEGQLAVEEAMLAELKAKTKLNEELRLQTLSSEKSFIETKKAWYQKQIQIHTDLATLRHDEKELYLKKQVEQLNTLEQDLLSLGEYLKGKLANYEDLAKDEIFSEYDEDLHDTRQELLTNKVSLSELQVKKHDLDYQKLQFLAEHQTRLDDIEELNRKLEELDVQIARLDQAELTENSQQNMLIKEAEGRVQRLTQNLSHQSVIKAPYSGKVIELNIAPGQVLAPGQQIGSMENNAGTDALVVVAYFPVKDGKKVAEGMPTRVTPTTVKKERFGSILGQVTSVSSIPRSTDSIAATIGNKELAQSLGTGGSMIEVRSNLKRSDETSSGYEWSSGKGPEIKVTSGMTVAIDATTEYRKPITFLLPFLKELGGN